MKTLTILKIAQNWKTEIKIGQIERSDRIKKSNKKWKREKLDKIGQIRTTMKMGQDWDKIGRLLDKDEIIGEIEKWIKKNK